MATGTWQVYGLGMKAIMNKEVDLDGNANLYMMFTSSSEVPDVDTDDYENDITANEVTGTNLSSGGVALTNAVASYDSATNTIKFDCDDVSVANVTASDIKNLHIVDKTSGVASTNPLIAYCVLDSALNPSAGTLSVTIDSAGVFTITV